MYYVTLVWNKASSDATFPKQNSHAKKVSLYQHIFYYLTIIFYVCTWHVCHLSPKGLKWDGKGEASRSTNQQQSPIPPAARIFQRRKHTHTIYKALQVSPGTRRQHLHGEERRRNPRAPGRQRPRALPGDGRNGSPAAQGEPGRPLLAPAGHRGKHGSGNASPAPAPEATPANTPTHPLPRGLGGERPPEGHTAPGRGEGVKAGPDSEKRKRQRRGRRRCSGARTAAGWARPPPGAAWGEGPLPAAGGLVGRRGPAPQRRSCGLGVTRRERGRACPQPAPGTAGPARTWPQLREPRRGGRRRSSPPPFCGRDTERGPPPSPPSPRGSPWRLTSGSRSPPPSFPLSTARSLPVPLRPPPFWSRAPGSAGQGGAGTAPAQWRCGARATWSAGGGAGRGAGVPPIGGGAGAGCVWGGARHGGWVAGLLSRRSGGGGATCGGTRSKGEVTPQGSPRQREQKALLWEPSRSPVSPRCGGASPAERQNGGGWAGRAGRGQRGRPSLERRRPARRPGVVRESWHPRPGVALPPARTCTCFAWEIWQVCYSQVRRCLQCKWFVGTGSLSLRLP